jgi:hypothetical protein
MKILIGKSFIQLEQHARTVHPFMFPRNRGKSHAVVSDVNVVFDDKEVVRSPGFEPGPDPFYGSEG